MAVKKMTPEGEKDMSPEEVREFLAGQAAFAQQARASELRKAALDALSANDRVAVRCLKASVAYPTEWLDYDVALRAVIATGTGPLPEQPDFPQGT
jgi:hypothetical protein